MRLHWRPGHVGTWEQISAAILALFVAFLIGAYVFNPIKEVQRHVAEPIARDVGVLPTPCPSGWNHDSAGSQDVRVEFCKKGIWTVWLKADGSFDHGWDGKAPDFMFDPSQVPGWQ